jgi:hypothetical protein
MTIDDKTATVITANRAHASLRRAGPTWRNALYTELSTGHKVTADLERTLSALWYNRPDPSPVDPCLIALPIYEGYVQFYTIKGEPIARLLQQGDRFLYRSFEGGASRVFDQFDLAFRV